MERYQRNTGNDNRPPFIRHHYDTNDYSAILDYYNERSNRSPHLSSRETPNVSQTASYENNWGTPYSQDSTALYNYRAENDASAFYYGSYITTSSQSLAQPMSHATNPTLRYHKREIQNSQPTPARNYHSDSNIARRNSHNSDTIAASQPTLRKTTDSVNTVHHQHCRRDNNNQVVASGLQKFCYYGAKCRRRDCWYIHPSNRQTMDNGRFTS
jgi:hypothetical protein